MIDVLLPFYGDPGLMRAAVGSVLAQDSERWRLTIVDDGYPDEAFSAWLGSLASPQVRYLRNASQIGVEANFNRALTLATADHVVFMGCDDLLAPGYVSAMERALGEHPDAAVIAPDVQVIDAGGRPASPLVDRVKRVLRPRVRAPRTLEGEAALVSLLRGNWTYFPSLCWRRDLIADTGFRAGYGIVLDLGLLVDVLVAGGRMLLLPDTQFRYRRHASSESSVATVAGSRFAEERRFFAEVAADLSRRGLPRAARAARRHATSRLHAGALLPGAAIHRDHRTFGRLVGHMLL